jgi:hypothetical protein
MQHRTVYTLRSQSDNILGLLKLSGDFAVLTKYTYASSQRGE